MSDIVMKIPAGNVTFLFTDIEGSTKLSQDFPGKLPAALEKHNQILTKVIKSHNGFIFQTVGDAFCGAFESSVDAVRAAVEIQIGLSKEEWDEAVIRVRAGIHSGNAEWSGSNYLSYMTLARTARVMSAAYGGQILVSNFVYESCKDSFNKESDVSFRDLGERRLKDVIQPIRLYQIIGRGLREDFPPLKTLDARPNNLPIQLNNFIGREKEMKHARELLRDSRLLTIAGAGGAGKTRFSLQIAADLIDEFENGVWLVELAAISDPFLLPESFLDSLGVKEESGKTPEETLTDYLREKEILIILDNCEHLVEACAVMAENLLLKCPKLKIIATSREALICKGEQAYRIPPLTHPDPNSRITPGQLIQYESARLFIERALAVNPAFRVTDENAPALAEICSRLDGIPLAIELAAARTRILLVEKICERLNDRFSLLAGGKRTALPRQQTLRALIDWSYDLLSEKERILWSRVSVFTGGWTLEAAEEVCSDEKIDKSEILDLLDQLIEKSILIYDEANERYRMLETIKQYGIEKLQDANEVFLRHLNYYLELSETARPELQKENIGYWLGIMDADHNNFLSAIDWSLISGNTEKGARVAAALGGFWNIKGHYSTGIAFIRNILQSSGALDRSLKGKILHYIGVLKKNQGDYEQAKKYSGESLDISKETGDKRRISVSLNNLGNISYDQGDYEQARRCYEECLDISKEIGDKRGVAVSMNNLGNISYDQGDYEQARKYYRESLFISKEIGDKRGIAFSMNSLGQISNYQGEYEQAVKYCKESLTISKEIGDRFVIAASLNNLGDISNYLGDYEQAGEYYKECLDISKETGDKRGIAYSMNNLGTVSRFHGDYEQARKYSDESLSISKEIGDKSGIATCMNSLAAVSHCQGDNDQAWKYYKESLSIRKDIGDKYGIAVSLNSLGTISISKGNHELAVKLLSTSEKIMESIGGVFDKDSQRRKDEAIAKLSGLISDSEFSNYREAGKNMTLEEACKLIPDI